MRLDDGQGEFEFDGDFEEEEEHGAARWSDPKTSHDAAESISPAHLYTAIKIILAWAHAHPYEAAQRCSILTAQILIGLQSHEIAHLSKIATGKPIGYGSITPRMPTMRKRDWIYNTGQTRAWAGTPGDPRSTRQSTVWQLTDLKGKP